MANLVNGFIEGSDINAGSGLTINRYNLMANEPVGGLLVALCLAGMDWFLIINDLGLAGIYRTYI